MCVERIYMYMASFIDSCFSPTFPKANLISETKLLNEKLFFKIKINPGRS